MKKWTVRAISLYVFDVVVLLLVGWVLRSVSVGWHALWAALVLTAATLLIKPLLLRAFRAVAKNSASRRSKAAEKTVQYAIVYVVQLIVWILTVWFSGVRVHGWFWGYVIPPLLLLLAWVVYDLIDDRLEAKTGELLGRIGGASGRDGSAVAPDPAASAPGSSASAAGRAELRDGLTAEQRKMLDELG